MKLRKLEIKDAPLMLQWMHDKSVVSHLGANFAEKTIEDCKNFILSSWEDKDNMHLAVADDSDEYMGTVSLKHINRELGAAEFAITVRAEAMGKGFSRYAMTQIIKLGFQELQLQEIYWCVSPANIRAVRFYDKCGYLRAAKVPDYISAPYSDQMPLYWYACYNLGDFLDKD